MDELIICIGCNDRISRLSVANYAMEVEEFANNAKVCTILQTLVAACVAGA